MILYHGNANIQKCSISFLKMFISLRIRIIFKLRNFKTSEPQKNRDSEVFYSNKVSKSNVRKSSTEMPPLPTTNECFG